MQVIPVLDLMGGPGRSRRGRAASRVSPDRKRAGRRRSTREPWLRALAAIGFRTAYVADLDAIGGGEPAWSIYRELLDAGLEPWIDAGVSSVEQAERAIAVRSRRPQDWQRSSPGLESLTQSRIRWPTCLRPSDPSG